MMEAPRNRSAHNGSPLPARPSWPAPSRHAHLGANQDLPLAGANYTAARKRGLKGLPRLIGRRFWHGPTAQEAQGQQRPRTSGDAAARANPKIGELTAVRPRRRHIKVRTRRGTRHARRPHCPASRSAGCRDREAAARRTARLAVIDESGRLVGLLCLKKDGPVTAPMKESAREHDPLLCQPTSGSKERLTW
jgi:hypothetical protein